MSTTPKPPEGKHAAVRFDPGALVRIRQLQSTERPNLAAGLVQIFLRDTRTREAAMVEAAAQDDLAQLTHQAHSLKSSASALGAMQLSKLCLALERAGRGERREDVQPLLQALLTELPYVRERLEEELRSG